MVDTAAVRQAEEVEALQSIFYEEGEFVLHSSSSFTVRVPLEPTETTAATVVSLTFTLPKGYPVTEPPWVSIHGPLLPRHAERVLQQQLQTLAETTQAGGHESVLPLVEWTKSNAREYMVQDPPTQSLRETRRQDAAVLRCVVVWFHHIKNPIKRQRIVEWAKGYDLVGVSRPGTPGLVFVEGEPLSVSEYLAALRGLSWKKMSVTFEEDCKDTLRHFDTFEEHLCASLVDLYPLFQRAGLEEAFRLGAKIPETWTIENKNRK